jgi:phosphoribosylanthranilate isomerase
VLIDSKIGEASGGTGVAFDWKAAGAVLAEAGNGLEMIVAGGLRPQNVAEAIASLSPWGVDVASGVESSPGHKSPEKLAAFIRMARA